MPLDQSHPPVVELAHVLFMNIVSYSVLPMDEQRRALRQLQELVRSNKVVVRAEEDGELLRLPTGDGMALVFFSYPEAPVRCALELAQALREIPMLPLRVGIHTGPVYRVEDINANRNVSGGGINMAQRIMDVGDAGHILLSQSVADVLLQLSNWRAFIHDLWRGHRQARYSPAGVQSVHARGRESCNSQQAEDKRKNTPQSFRSGARGPERGDPRKSSHFALPHCAQAGWRRDGSGVQGRRPQAGPKRGAEVPAG